MWIGYYVIILLIGLFLPFLNMPIFNEDGYYKSINAVEKADLKVM